MPHIVQGFKTKKALREGVAEVGRFVEFSDPSIFQPKSYYWKRGVDTNVSNIPVGADFTCTNHPKRSWFARVQMTAAKGLIVS